MKTIILTGGGTAGHVFGSIALLEELKKIFDRIVFLGSQDGIEKKIISKYKEVEYISIPTTKLIRKFSIKNLSIPFVLIKSIKVCKKIIDELKPNIIFSKGGYVSVPVCLAGHKKHIPIIIHESDISLGLANKITKNKASVVCTSFLETANKINNALFSGAPIRQELFLGNKQKTKKKFGISNEIPVLLVCGGSLGAQSLNNLVWQNLDYLCSRFFVIHLTGREKAKNISHKNYAELEFCDNMKQLYAVADFCLTRGGANALFELLALKIPMLISPLLKQSRGEQKQNAKYFCDNGFALCLEKETEEELKEKIEKLTSSKKHIINNMNNYSLPNSIEIIINQIKKFSL